MIIKRKVLKSIYGGDTLPLELKPTPRKQPEQFNGNSRYYQESQAQEAKPESIDALAEDLVKARVDELYALKEAEVAQIEKQAQIDIQKALDDSKILAQKILDDAQNQANSLKAQTLDELEKQKQEMTKLAKAESERGFSEGMFKAETYVRELMNILSSFNHAKRDILLEVKEQIAGLGIHVAQQILEREVQTNPELLEEQVLKAINLVSSGSGIIQVYLNPIDQAKAVYLEKNLSKLIDESVKLVFLKDETIDQGSCIINTKGGRLDLNFTSQINLIKVAFEMYLGHKIEEITESSELDQAEIESMQIDPSKIIKTQIGPAAEPSDEDLELIELEADEFEDLVIDDDLDALLKEVLMEDGADIKDDASVKTDDDIVLSEIDDENYNTREEEEITLKYDDDDSLDLGEDKDDLMDDDDISLDMDEFDELADDPEASSDDDLNDSGLDDRFPEY